MGSLQQPLILKAQGTDDGRDEYLIVDQSPFTIGRRPNNHVQIARADVSGQHAEFRFDRGAWWLIDHQSTNGTFLNGKRIGEDTALSMGDVVHFATKGYQVVPHVEMDSSDGSIATTRLESSSDIRRMMDLLTIINEHRAISVFQPIVDLKSDEPVGWEALGRGVGADGPVSPGLLFSLAAQNRTEGLLSARFRESGEACVSCGHCWKRSRPGFLFFNLHPAELQKERFGQLLAQIADSELRKQYEIVIEMPESFVCENSEEMKRIVEQIRGRGMQVAYDDFGQGQSRITDLINAPPDFLKLDRQLVADLAEHRVKKSLVKAIVDACRELHVRAIGEGIETREEHSACIEMQIDYGQGYYLCRPNPAYSLFTVEPATLPESCPFVRFGLLPPGN